MTRRWFQGWGHGDLADAMEVAGWRVLMMRITEEWLDVHAVATDHPAQSPASPASFTKPGLV